MAIKALDPMTPFWSTLDQKAVEGEEMTSFKIQGLTGSQATEVAVEYLALEGNVTNITAKGIELCLKYGLKDWKVFADGQGDVEFKISNFNLIPSSYRIQLAWDIIEASNPSDEEIKNS